MLPDASTSSLTKVEHCVAVVCWQVEDEDEDVVDVGSWLV